MCLGRLLQAQHTPLVSISRDPANPKLCAKILLISALEMQLHLNKVLMTIIIKNYLILVINLFFGWYSPSSSKSSGFGLILFTYCCYNNIPVCIPICQRGKKIFFNTNGLYPSWWMNSSVFPQLTKIIIFYTCFKKKRVGAREAKQDLVLVLLVVRKLQNVHLRSKQFSQSAGTSIFLMSLVYNLTPCF